MVPVLGNVIYMVAKSKFCCEEREMSSVEGNHSSSRKSPKDVQHAKGSPGGQAGVRVEAMKVQVRQDLLSGRLDAPEVV